MARKPSEGDVSAEAIRQALEPKDAETTEEPPSEEMQRPSGGFFGVPQRPEESLMDRDARVWLGDVPEQDAGPVHLTYMQGLAWGVDSWVDSVEALLEVSGTRGGRHVERLTRVAEAHPNAGGSEAEGMPGASASILPDQDGGEDVAQEATDNDASGWLAGWGLA